MVNKRSFGEGPVPAGSERALREQNSRFVSQRVRQEAILRREMKAHQEKASQFQVNNVVQIQGDNRLGLGRIIAIDQKTGALSIRFHRGVKNYMPAFVEKVSDV
jgi:hypothetical protein